MTGSSKPLARYFEEDFSPVVLRKASENTKHQYRNAVRKFVAWSGCDIQVHLVTETLVDRFGRAIVMGGMSVDNARKYVAYIRRIARERYPERCLKQMGKRPHEWAETFINGLSEKDLDIDGSVFRFWREFYVPKRMIGTADSSVATQRHNIRALAKFLGRPPMLSDLNDDTITEFISWNVSSGLSHATANTRRATLLAIWRYAVKRGLLSAAPRDVEKVKELRRLPEAWTMEELGSIIETARRKKRKKSGLPCPVGMWWEAFILVAYDTGLRLRAMLGIKRSGWNAERREITATAEVQKHKVQQTFVVSEQAAEAVNRVLANWQTVNDDDTTLFHWPIGVDQLHRQYKDILLSAGVYRGPKDGFHKLRRTSASHLAKALGMEAACRQLGHSSVQMTHRYVDPRMMGDHNAAQHLPRPILPPKRPS